MDSHAPPPLLRLACHRVRGHLDVQNTVVGDGLAVEAKGACASEAPADLARPHRVDMHVGQRIPGLAHSTQSAVRDDDSDGFIIEPHSPQIGSSCDAAEGGSLPFVSHIRGLSALSDRARHSPSSVQIQCPVPPVEEHPTEHRADTRRHPEAPETQTPENEHMF
jgi:hypothetical protein